MSMIAKIYHKGVVAKDDRIEKKVLEDDKVHGGMTAEQKAKYLKAWHEGLGTKVVIQKTKPKPRKRKGRTQRRR